MLYADPVLNSAELKDLEEVKDFLKEFFNYSGENENVPNLEYVFGFIDFFLSKGGSAQRILHSDISNSTAGKSDPLHPLHHCVLQLVRVAPH